MDDNVSIKSSESMTTSGEYEIISDTMEAQEKENFPTLMIGHNRGFQDLKNDMTEAIQELDKDDTSSSVTEQKSLTASLLGTESVNPIELALMDTLCIATENQTSDTQTTKTTDNMDYNKVGKSVFYDCIDANPADREKHDDMKPERSDTEDEVSDIDQGCTIFSGVTYLGAANINAPKSETDIYRIMCELNSEPSSVGLKISISIPNCSEGLIVLYDNSSNFVIASYEIQSIILYFRGPAESTESGCFAYTWLHGDSLFQCHVFRCHIPEAVNQVSACFQKAFQHFPPNMTNSLTTSVGEPNVITSDISGNIINSAGYEFIVSLEIKEKVTKTSYTAVPRDRTCFKLRANTDKEVCITVKQTQSNVLQPLYIERCFGVLLSPGKLVRQADMQLLDMVSMGYLTQSSELTCIPFSLCPYYIRADWKAGDKAFVQLNLESQKTILTVAVDLVIRGIQEPVRFIIETPVAIQSQTEMRIMDHFISKRPLMLRFYLQLKRSDESNWEVSSIDPSDEILEQAQTSSSYLLKFGINNLSRIVRSASIVSIDDDSPTDYSSDGDEPLLSGTGEVSKDCSQDTLDEWDPILKEWDSEKRPKNLAALVKSGVPEALREKVWQKLSNVEGKTDMTDMYKTLLTKETKCETIIQRDIHRTFPAHKCFKETGGSGQDSLFKVSKAYAVYDAEVGYCQGLSFIAASLLLHMPEEDAFCVLVALMYDYGLRDLYKQGFEVLYLRLFQLDRLIREHLPKLHEHFLLCGIETHMFASQWFLTLFTARFPLYFVFHVLDVFLLDGLSSLFQVAITLLSICESDLRQLDFEGILKYFRVTLPKKCRSSSQSRKVMKMACERKIKKLKQYEEEFYAKKQHKEQIEKESRIYEEKFKDERRKYETEKVALQQKLEKSNEMAIQMDRKHTGIIQDYKRIIKRLEQEMAIVNETLSQIVTTVSKCENCSKSIKLEEKFNLAGKRVLQKIHKTEEADLGPLDPFNIALQRIRELELELAQTKLAQVEAECKNQDLNHQLNATLTEIQSNRGSWQPWLSKTLNSLQDKVIPRGHRDMPTFQSYANPSDTSLNPANQLPITK